MDEKKELFENVPVNPLFMFVVFPSGMEVFAAALATLLSNIAAMIYFFVMIRKVSAKAPLSISYSDCRKALKDERKEVISVGIPSAILPGLYDLSNIFLNARAAAHGDLQLAAIGIVLKVERLPNAIGIHTVCRQWETEEGHLFIQLPDSLYSIFRS